MKKLVRKILDLKNEIKANARTGFLKYQDVRHYKSLKKSPLLKSQWENPKSIPILIINYNQLSYLKKLIDFLIKRDFQNIIIIDNNSDYPPLLEYYNEIKDRVIIEKMSENIGHKVFFKTPYLQEKYGQGYYVITDADIVPNEDLPDDFLNQMLYQLDKNFNKLTKVGFALDIKTVPDFYPYKEEVLLYESKYWENPKEKNQYWAYIDTTFALYKPQYPEKHKQFHRLEAIRMAGNFVAKHGGWYVDPNNFSEEELHYIKSVQKSSTWKLNEKGELDNKGKKRKL